MGKGMKMENELRFHHVGIACHDIAITRTFYVEQGYTAGDVVIDPLRDVKICFLDKPGSPQLELLAPLDESSPINRILSSQGVTPYHICYAVDNIDAAVLELRQKKFVCVSKTQPACALDGRGVCFMYHKHVGLIELLES